MKLHHCPTCERSYRCPRGVAECGSPHLYECHCCYLRRYHREIQALAAAVAAKFTDDQSCFGDGDFCYAH